MYIAGVSPKRVIGRTLAYSLIILGAIILVASGSYFVYSWKAKAALDEEVVKPSPERVSELLPAGWNAVQSGTVIGAVGSDSLSANFPASFENLSSTDQVLQEPPLIGEGGIPYPSKDYRYVDWATLPQTVEELPQATRIVIPAIGVDSPIVELGIIMEDGKAVWKRPVNAVGHHIGTPHPGEAGNVVMSGHRSSPIRGEGAVFRRLGEAPKLLEQQLQGVGEPVDIFVYTPEKGYVYRVVGTEVLEPGEVDVFRPTSEPTLTLITCTPDLIYSHRLIITAWLIAEVAL